VRLRFAARSSLTTQEGSSIQGRDSVVLGLPQGKPVGFGEEPKRWNTLDGWKVPCGSVERRAAKAYARGLAGYKKVESIGSRSIRKSYST
jgi:hypothetical protein